MSFFNGAPTLFRYGYQKASISKVLHDGKAMDYIAPMPVKALLGPAPISRYQINEQIAKSAKSSPRYPVLHLATENEDIAMILKYLNMELGWVTYYKVLEAVEDFAKARGINLGIDTASRKAFTNTANNFSLSGFDSRHGFKEVVKENKTRAMSLDEAHEFIFNVVKSFLVKANF